MRARSALLFVLMLSVLPPALAHPARADEPAIQIKGAEGTELSAKEEKAVKKTLSDYLAALQKQDYKQAGELIDRPSLLATVDPMVATISSDSTTKGPAMRKIFGVSTRDSIEARSNGQLFTSLMAFMMKANPNAAAVLSKATIEVLAALQKQDYKKAGELIDRPSLLAAVDPMVATIASDSTARGPAMRKIFGVSTRDSIEARSNGQLFSSLMAFMMEANPNAAGVLSKATIDVLAARKMGDRVHVAYRLTLPPAEPGGLPYEQITAQRMSKFDGKWRILFSIDQ